MIRILEQKPAWIEWPLKAILLLLFAVVVCFPRLDLLVVSLKRYANPNALINPESEALIPWIEEFEKERDLNWKRPVLAKNVERFVYKKLPYEWDWNLWANADYFPTVEEAVAKGKEDCDGRAIVAASMLEHYGIKATLVSDLIHVWLKTDAGEVMGARKSHATLGKKDASVFAMARQFIRALGFSISIFPLSRELLILGFASWLLLPTGFRWEAAVPFLLLTVIGLMLLREGGQHSRNPDLVKNSIGALVLLGGLLGVFLQRKIGAKSSA